jgi:hypothetical protein
MPVRASVCFFIIPVCLLVTHLKLGPYRVDRLVPPCSSDVESLSSKRSSLETAEISGDD